MRWQFPVYASEADKAAPTGGSSARLVRKALPREQAFAELTGDDPRPLLVMRECDWCEGTDDALLNKRLDNERTVLMSHWFHAVKLPNHVLQDDHPFRNLFPEDDVPHLFMATRDGSVVVGLDGQQSPVELWEAMDEVLGEAGVRNPEKALKKVTKVLDQFDRLDIDRQRLRSELDELLEEHGPKSGKVKKVAKKLEQADEEREELIAELAELTGAHVTAGLSR